MPRRQRQMCIRDRLRVVAEPATAVAPGSGWGWVLVASALMQWLAAVFFVVNSWPRVKERYRGE